MLVGNVVLALIYMHSSIVHYMSFIRKKFLVGRRSLEKYANYYDKVRGKGEENISVKRVLEKYQHAIDNVRRTRFHVTTIAA